MMRFIFLLSFLVQSSVFAKFVADGCPSHMIRMQSPQTGFYCAPMMATQFPAPQNDCFMCQQLYWQRQMAANPWQGHFQNPFIQNPYSPWWAQQGSMMYPNFHAPGSWQYPGMNPNPYPGNAPVFAAKPNVYVSKKSEGAASFKIKFDMSQTKASFLATTPYLENNGWNGVISDDEFKVQDVSYDYLFYDARMSHETMQFEAGWCVRQDNLVKSMMGELIQMGFSQNALRDFQEHWDEKIPKEEIYCVYPQYNKELDAAMPISIEPVASFKRVVFVLVPHRLDDNIADREFPKLPYKSHYTLRPVAETSDIEFMEWGVAFLDHNLIK